jgi:hypothetical protein
LHCARFAEAIGSVKRLDQENSRNTNEAVGDHADDLLDLPHAERSPRIDEQEIGGQQTQHEGHHSRFPATIPGREKHGGEKKDEGIVIVEQWIEEISHAAHQDNHSECERERMNRESKAFWTDFNGTFVNIHHIFLDSVF